MNRIICFFLGHQWEWIYNTFEAVCHRCHKRMKAEPSNYYYGDDTNNIEI